MGLLGGLRFFEGEARLRARAQGFKGFGESRLGFWFTM